MSNVQILRDHTSFDTAYEVSDYPYGVRLRCKKRYWVERSTKGQAKGQYRLVTCTSNPKYNNEVWNKPKAETYYALVVLYIDPETGHVKYDGLYPYSETQAIEFRKKWYEHLNDDQKAYLDGLDRARERWNKRIKKANEKMFLQAQ